MSTEDKEKLEFFKNKKIKIQDDMLWLESENKKEISEWFSD